MTELTKQLTKQLILHQNDTVIKDLKADPVVYGATSFRRCYPIKTALY
jgi:hypothetical protein